MYYVPGSALKTRQNNIVLVPVLFRGIQATLTKFWDQWSISLTLKCIVNTSQSQTHRKHYNGFYDHLLPLRKVAKGSNFPHVKSLYFAMRRILTKGFTSLWNPMKLQAKPFVATMRRKCLVKSTTGLPCCASVSAQIAVCNMNAPIIRMVFMT